MARQQRPQPPGTHPQRRRTGRTSPADVLRVPVLADGADPGRVVPKPLAVRDRVSVDRRLVGDRPEDRLFAYDVADAHMKHLRGLASPGDRLVFQRGGRVTDDRICAVRTPQGIVLARVAFDDRGLVLLPGEDGGEAVPVELDPARGLRGVIAGTHVLLIPH